MSKPPPCTDVSTHTCVTEPCTCVWLPGLSDTELKFEDNNKVVCRNKNDGCYPASTSSWQPQPSGQSTFAVRVDHYATRPINSLTIGVAETMHRGCQASVGHKRNSVGLHFATENAVFANGRELCAAGRVRAGDILSVLIDADTNRLRLYHNGFVVGPGVPLMDPHTECEDGQVLLDEDSGWLDFPGPFDKCRVWVTLNDNAKLRIV
eukprot:m.131362 g.131362  ORF g.131362 m.131362 type:complete len:207 (-) comp16815_c0_seq3:71-691(-)